jgi:hypothetical protein
LEAKEGGFTLVEEGLLEIDGRRHGVLVAEGHGPGQVTNVIKVSALWVDRVNSDAKLLPLLRRVGEIA